MNGLKKDKKNFKTSNKNLLRKKNNKEYINVKIERNNEKEWYSNILLGIYIEL